MKRKIIKCCTFQGCCFFYFFFATFASLSLFLILFRIKSFHAEYFFRLKSESGFFSQKASTTILWSTNFEKAGGHFVFFTFGAMLLFFSDI